MYCGKKGTAQTKSPPVKEDAPLGSCTAPVAKQLSNGFCFMKATEIFEDVLNVVCITTGIERADVLVNRSEASTDARYILVRYLAKLLPHSIIAQLLGRTRQGIRSILNRQKGDTWLVQNNWKAVVKQLESKYFISK